MSSQDRLKKNRDPATERFRFRVNIAILTVVALVFTLLYFLWPPFGSGVNRITSAIAHGDMEGLKSYLTSFGPWSPIVAGLIMIFQAIVAPLPAFVPALANGLLFGPFWGTLLTWSTAIIGALACFYIARSLGRPAVERIVSRKAMNSVDAFFERHGTNAVLIARLLPVVSFSAISYVSGVTSISLWGYLWTTAVGILPGTIVFCLLGDKMTDLTKFIWYAVTGIAALIVLGFAVKAAADKRSPAKRAKPAP